MEKKKFFHGTDKELSQIDKGSFVTKSFKDACKFGYRKAVVNNSSNVFVYELKECKLTQDKNRDRAFVLENDCSVKLVNKYDTYKTPYKLKLFRKTL